MEPKMATEDAGILPSLMAELVAAAVDYMVDAGQRSVLFLDIIRRRGDQYREHIAKTAPNVLHYSAELIVDGRELDEPVNYGLVRINPPDGVEINTEQRPFIVVDPRAGHGPGIGGFKADSEIGVALNAGHPCYFIGFLPEPMPGQTIERIAHAEAQFIEKVISLHPEANGKPCVVGNCQAGWAVMILASLRPDLFGPIIIAGAPLAYWAGVHGKYPMRYSGGLLGGSWLTALTSDVGAGKFDGSWLVQNFENQNPSNTLWTKQYNVYSKVDNEAERYLEFERWWGAHVNLNAEEMQFIVDELFVGNNLAAGNIVMSDGQRVDLRSIRSPIVVFCSAGDNITPPQEALDWILDCYADVDEIRAYGQTIVYTIHKSIGHLGIFVSGGIAKKEHAEFSSNIDLIDVLPPGLYEATFEAKDDQTTHSDLVAGQWIMRCEARALDDIRALGGNSAADERCFAAAKRVSEINLAAYKTFVQPWIKGVVTPQMAELMRHLHPLRIQYEALGSQNPWMSAATSSAAEIKDHRKPVSNDNPFWAFQEQISKEITGVLDTLRDTQEAQSEAIFLTVYGSPALQTALGIDPQSAPRGRREMSDEDRDRLMKRIDEAKSKINDGGIREAAIRSLIYIGMARGLVDERTLEALRRVRRDYIGARLTLSEFKMLVREQFFMLLLDQAAALAAIPKLLPDDIAHRRVILDLIREILSVSGDIEGERASRLQQVSSLFALETR
jgi:hypothetical protein